MQKLKANSSRWLGENGVQFEWQKGYKAFGLSRFLLPTVQSYIRNQAEHPKKRSFEEEFWRFLKKSGVGLRRRTAICSLSGVADATRLLLPHFPRTYRRG
jgi:hypothetical protein